MQLNRRGLLSGLLCAPVIIRTPGLLMPIKPLSQPLKLTYLASYHWSVLPDRGWQEIGDAIGNDMRRLFYIRLYHR